MLVLTRKINQSIRVGEDITITIVKIHGNSIRIGIEAPREVRVVRGELRPEIQEKTFTEFDLEGLDAETFEALAAAADEPMPSGQVYQMRQTVSTSRASESPKNSSRTIPSASAPLARYLPPLVRESLASYSH